MSARAEARRDYWVFRWTQMAFVLFLVSYVLIVLERESVMGRGEIFPIFSWSLFSKVPNIVHDYSVLIHEVDGKIVSPPTVWDESGAHFEAAVHHTAYVVLTQIGSAMAAGNAERAEELRLKFETLHMREARDVRYELVERTFDPIVRIKDGGYETITAIASYRKRSR